MNNGMLLIGLMLAGLFLFRRQTVPGQDVNWLGSEWSLPGTVGGYGEG
jgi:ADP-ribose pyrophosphatase YjhB (NUDIX family)